MNASLGSDVEIVVEDNGPGFVAGEAAVSGLGTQLIRSLSEQIGGDYGFEINEGSRFRLRFPKTPQLLRAVAE